MQCIKFIYVWNIFKYFICLIYSLQISIINSFEFIDNNFNHFLYIMLYTCILYFDFYYYYSILFYILFKILLYFSCLLTNKYNLFRFLYIICIIYIWYYTKHILYYKITFTIYSFVVHIWFFSYVFLILFILLKWNLF